MEFSDHILLQVLRDPEKMATLSLSEWDALKPLARSTLVISKIAALAHKLDLLDLLPEQIVPHLTSAHVFAARHDRAVRWEVNRVQRALRDVNTPIILLKGAAYAISNMACATGRVYGDTDILVLKDRLGEVENSLTRHGWDTDEDNEYDERYYRTWLHELPPMRHRERGTVLDVHHNILPRIDKLQINIQLLFESAIPINGTKVCVLSPPDMVLHSAAHLFRIGNFDHGLRDLADLDELIRQFNNLDGFWDSVLDRAQQLKLTLPWYSATRYVEYLFHTPIPDRVKRTVAKWAPLWPEVPIIDRLVKRAVLPRKIDDRDVRRQMAISLLGHWPLPRLKVTMTGLFWIKRMPWFAKQEKT